MKMSKRYRKWLNKTRPEDTFYLLRKTRGLSIEAEKEYQPLHENLIRRVKQVLYRYGSESVRTHAYVWFAQGLWYAKERYSSMALQKEANALFMYFYLLGLNEDALRDVARSFGINIPPISDIVGITTMSEEIVYQGTKRALKETLERVETDLTDKEIFYNPDGTINYIVKTDKVTGKKKKLTFYYDANGNLIKIVEEEL